MTCADCIRHASENIAMAEELAALRALVEGTTDEKACRVLSAWFNMPPRSARVVYLLWLASERFVNAGVLMDALWPDKDGERADYLLRVAIMQARRGFRTTVEAKVDAIETGPDGSRTYRLTAEGSRLVCAALPPSLLPKPPRTG